MIKTASALWLGLLLLMLAGCGQMISNAKREFAQDLAATILEHDDPDTIADAMPAYMVLVSSMIRSDPDNVDLLLSGAELYASYASVFVDNKQRKRVLAQRAYDYASHALCIRKPTACDADKLLYPQFEQSLKQFTQADAGILFAYSSAWAGLIQASSADWNAVAELPRVKAALLRVIALDETTSQGDAHIYMGVLESMLPASMGGKPELAREHFEKAIKISNNSNQFGKVLFAEKYARLIFDRELHDTLLREVVAADISHSTRRLIDVIAQRRALNLLGSASDYF